MTGIHMHISSTATLAFGIILKREPKVIKEAGSFDSHVDEYIEAAWAKGLTTDEETFPAQCVQLDDEYNQELNGFIYAVNGAVFEISDGIKSMSKLEPKQKQIDAFIAWCAEVGIKSPKPKWLLVSQTSY
jgi:hypothetical protein